MPPTSTSIHNLDCQHTYLRQTILSPTFPPLYIALPTSSLPSQSHLTINRLPQPIPIKPALITHLKRVHAHLGPRKARSPFLASDIALLQHELEAGMTRGRREQVQLYVMGIRDPWKKAAAELYLARYPGFAIGGDGRLDYGTRGRDDEEVGRGRGEWKWGCGVM